MLEAADTGRPPPPTPPSEAARRRRRLLDVLVVLAFAAYAICAHVDRRGHPRQVLDLSSDAGNIASFAAALDHPERMKGDMVLADADNFRFYWTIHIPLLRGLVKVTGDYGSAYVAMQGPHVFLYLLGFYVLGRVLLRKVAWAVLLAVMLIVPFYIRPLSTFWGLWRDPLPRVTISALLGFAWAGALAWRERPARWPLLMAVAGGFMYLHPVGAPVIALGLWLAFWSHRPPGWRWPKRLAWLLLCGLAAVVVAAPFAVNYMTSHVHGRIDRADLVRQVFEYRLSRSFYDAPFAAWEFLKLVTVRHPLLPLAALGVVGVWRLGTPVDRARLRVLGLWAVGVVVMSVAIPVAEQRVARAAGAMPLEVDLIRGLRFFVPLSVVAILWGLSLLLGSIRRAEARCVLAVGLLGVVLWVYLSGTRASVVLDPLAHAGRRLTGGQPDKPGPQHRLVLAIQRTAPGSRILPVGVDPLAIRYGAMRPVVYSHKDGGCLLYGNAAGAIRWYAIARRFDAMDELALPSDKAVVFREILEATAPRYLAFRTKDLPVAVAPPDARIIWQEEGYVLMRLADGDGPDR